MFVVAQDLVFGPRIERWHGVYPPQQIFDLAGEDTAATFCSQLLPALFQSLMNGLSQRFAGRPCDLASETLCGVVLDAECHL